MIKGHDQSYHHANCLVFMANKKNCLLQFWEGNCFAVESKCSNVLSTVTSYIKNNFWALSPLFKRYPQNITHSQALAASGI